MEWFKTLKVGTKLIAGFLLVSIIGGIIGIQGILKSAQINDLAKVMYERETVGLRHVAEANIQLIAANRSIQNAILSHTTEERDSNLRALNERMTRIYKELATAENTFVTEQGKQLVQEKLEDAEAAWQGQSTWGDLRNMEGQFLAKNGSLSSNMQTACLHRMLPPAKRKLLRRARKEDTVRGTNLWLTRDAKGLIHETEPDGRPSWILTNEPQAPQ
jgi:hypothetical protein